MSAYVIVDVEVTNPQAYTGYTSQVPSTLAPFGGEFIVRGGQTESFEGDWTPHRLVVIRFPSMEQARAWYQSPAYQKILPIRQQNSRARGVFVEGV